MKKLIVSVILLAALNCSGEILKLNEKLIRAIHSVETGNRFGAIKGDGGKALGPLQIHYSYWLDATEFDKTIGGSYSDCADYQYSCRVATAYLNRYGAKYIKSNDFEKLSRIHNGGPTGYKRASTMEYWKKIQARLDK